MDLLPHHSFVLVLGLGFFGLILIWSTRTARRTKEISYYIASATSSLFILAIVSIFLGAGILAGLTMFLMIPLAAIAWWKRPPLDVMEKNRIRILDFLPFSTLDSWVELARKRGIGLTILFFYVLITFPSAVILYAVSLPYGLDAPDIAAFIVTGPIIFTYFFHAQLREKIKEPKPTQPN